MSMSTYIILLASIISVLKGPTFEQTIVIAPNTIDCTEDKNETTIDRNVSVETVQNKE